MFKSKHIVIIIIAIIFFFAVARISNNLQINNSLTTPNLGSTSSTSENIGSETPKQFTQKSYFTGTGNFRAEIPKDAISNTARLQIGLVPDPSINKPADTIKVNDIYRLSAYEPNSQTAPTLLKPATVSITFQDSDLKFVKKETLSIYIWSKSENTWISLPTTVNLANKKATSNTQQLGQFNLRGTPINPPPSVANIQPSSILMSQGATISINGKNFSPTPSVNFGIGSYAAKFINSEKIEATIPPNRIAPGTYGIILINPDRQRVSSSNVLTVLEK